MPSPTRTEYVPGVFEYETTSEPVAQITVIHAVQGDANVVDFCYWQDSEPSNRYQAIPAAGEVGKQWTRTIIDTGPNAGKYANKGILQCLLNMSSSLKLPAPKGSGRSIVPKINELQITHLDFDHIGNARFFIDEIKKDPTQYPAVRDMKVIYPSFPDPKFTRRMTKVVPVKIKNNNATTVGGIMYNTAAWHLSFADEEWKDQMERAGYKFDIRLKPHSKLVMPAGMTTADFIHPGTPPHKDVLKLKYTKAADKFVVTLVCKIRLLDADSGAEVRMSDLFAQEYKLPPKAFTLDWVDDPNPTAKKQKTGSSTTGGGGPHAMLMAMNPQVRSLPLRPLLFAVNPKIRDLLEVAIDGLNDLAKKAPRHVFNVQAVAPIAGYQTVRPTVARNPATNKHDYAGGSMKLVGPSRKLYDKLVRTYVDGCLQGLLDKDSSKALKDSSLEDVTNRSSVVTVFERQDAAFVQPWTALFTGDAHDRECDIRDTIASWMLDPTRTDHEQEPSHTYEGPTFHVNVLKVPHHGSNATTRSEFYEYVRADVYIICGSFRTHGNPRFSSLKQIVQGFRGNTTVSGQPFLLFFSDPDIDQDYVENGKIKEKSPVMELLLSPNLAPDAANGMNYEMYCVKQDTVRDLVGNKPEMCGYGRLLFHKARDAAGHFTAGVQVAWKLWEWRKIEPLAGP